jgi:hypothetical protein
MGMFVLAIGSSGLNCCPSFTDKVDLFGVCVDIHCIGMVSSQSLKI